jgi:hypothetical protein
MRPGLRSPSLTSPLLLRVLTGLAPTTPPSNSSKVSGAGCHTPAARSWGHSKDEPRLVLMRAKPNGQTESQRPAKNRHITPSSVQLCGPPQPCQATPQTFSRCLRQDQTGWVTPRSHTAFEKLGTNLPRHFSLSMATVQPPSQRQPS